MPTGERIIVILSKKLVVCLIVLYLLGILVSCGSNEEESVEMPSTEVDTETSLPEIRYPDWNVYNFHKIQIVYPTEHPFKHSVPEIARGFESILTRSCQFLKIPIPDDTLRVYLYTGPGQGEHLTGAKYSFATAHAIHYWVPTYYGAALMKYLLPRWQPEGTRHEFLRHGLIALLDFSGENYHESTLNLLEKERFVTLEELIADTTVSSDRERWQSAEVASFVDYLVVIYGMDKFRQLYSSQESFKEAAAEIYDLTLPKMEKEWMRFAREAVALIDTTTTQ